MSLVLWRPINLDIDRAAKAKGRDRSRTSRHQQLAHAHAPPLQKAESQKQFGSFASHGKPRRAWQARKASGLQVLLKLDGPGAFRVSLRTIFRRLYLTTSLNHALKRVSRSRAGQQLRVPQKLIDSV